MSYKTLKDFDLRGKTVLLRADLNVPVQDGTVTDTTRIDRILPTITYLREQGAKTLILCHYGRPKGQVKPELSLEFLCPVLAKQWDVPVSFAADTVGPQAKALADNLAEGEFGLLENVRFHAEEEQNDPAFAKQLADLADIFVNDAFSAAHRAHASTEAITNYLPTCAGLSMEAELNALNEALEAPERPVLAIVGGAKVSTKLSVLNNLVQKVDYLVLGGGMSNTFTYASGTDVGLSLCEKDMADEAKAIIAKAKEHGCEIILPKDVCIVSELKEGADHEYVDRTAIPADKEAVDAGPAAAEYVAEVLQKCKTVLWNGPLGVFEISPFDFGTNTVAKTVADLTKDGKVVSVAGGGDTVSALENAGVASDFTYISTAGGAFLEWLEGKTLPGVAALESNKKAA